MSRYISEPPQRDQQGPEQGSDRVRHSTTSGPQGLLHLEAPEDPARHWVISSSSSFNFKTSKVSFCWAKLNQRKRLPTPPPPKKKVEIIYSNDTEK
jgi:hypothetical protein